MRVGCILDGGVLYCDVGYKPHLGPRWRRGGHEHHFGGHASEKTALSPSTAMAKIQAHLSRDDLIGLHTHLADGNVSGELHERSNHGDGDGDGDEIVSLEPGPNERVVGFFGRSDWCRVFHGIQEFGIITAPEDLELPEAVHGIPELRNTDGGLGDFAMTTQR